MALYHADRATMIRFGHGMKHRALCHSRGHGGGLDCAGAAFMTLSRIVTGMSWAAITRQFKRRQGQIERGVRNGVPIVFEYVRESGVPASTIS
jgi:hypothetical protein